ENSAGSADTFGGGCIRFADQRPAVPEGDVALRRQRDHHERLGERLRSAGGGGVRGRVPQGANGSAGSAGVVPTFYYSFRPPSTRARAPAPQRSSTGRPITLSHHREAEYAGGRPRHKEVRQVGLSLFLTTERQSTRARAPAPQRSSTGRPITLSHHREAEYAGGRPRHKGVRQVGLSLFLTTERQSTREGARATKKFDRSAYHSFSPPRGRVRGRGRPRHKEVRQVGLSLFLTTERQSTRARVPAPPRSPLPED